MDELNYEVIAVDIVEYQETLAYLWTQGVGSDHGLSSKIKLDHSYLMNPAGIGTVNLIRAVPANLAVGVQCLVFRRFFCGARQWLAGMLADYVVVPTHRSLGPALQLMKASVAGSRDSLALLYGFPNRKAEVVMRRAGFTPRLQLIRHAAPLRSAPYLAKWMPAALVHIAAWFVDLIMGAADRLREQRLGGSLLWESSIHGREDIDLLWGCADRENLFLSDRSSPVLWWRYKLDASVCEANSNSDEVNWQLDVAREPRTFEVNGYVVWMLRGRVAVIGDFFCRAPCSSTARLLASFRVRARAAGADSVSLECCGAESVILELAKAGLSPRESSPIYLFFNDTIPAVDAWYFTSFDRDVD